MVNEKENEERNHYSNHEIRTAHCNPVDKNRFSRCQKKAAFKKETTVPKEHLGRVCVSLRPL